MVKCFNVYILDAFNFLNHFIYFNFFTIIIYKLPHPLLYKFVAILFAARPDMSEKGSVNFSFRHI